MVGMASCMGSTHRVGETPVDFAWVQVVVVVVLDVVAVVQVRAFASGSFNQILPQSAR